MGVSINAVSKWERGLSFPDVSLYKKLCKELDINIEEFNVIGIRYELSKSLSNNVKLAQNHWKIFNSKLRNNRYS